MTEQKDEKEDEKERKNLMDQILHEAIELGKLRHENMKRKYEDDQKNAEFSEFKHEELLKFKKEHNDADLKALQNKYKAEEDLLWAVMRANIEAQKEKMKIMDKQQLINLLQYAKRKKKEMKQYEDQLKAKYDDTLKINYVIIFFLLVHLILNIFQLIAKKITIINKKLINTLSFINFGLTLSAMIIASIFIVILMIKQVFMGAIIALIIFAIIAFLLQLNINFKIFGKEKNNLIQYIIAIINSGITLIGYSYCFWWDKKNCGTAKNKPTD